MVAIQVELEVVGFKDLMSNGAGILELGFEAKGSGTACERKI